MRSFLKLKESAIGHSMSMSSAAVASKAFGMAKGLLLAKILGPEAYGRLNALLLITTYSEYSHFGVLNAMAREWPKAFGADDRERVEKIGAVSLGFILLTTGIVASGVAVAACLMNFSMPLRISLVIVAALIVSQQLLKFIQAVARVKLKFHQLASIRVAVASIQLFFCLLMAVYFSYQGVLVGLFIGQVVVLLWFWPRLGAGILPLFDLQSLRPLLRLGLSLVWINSSYALLMSLDRLFILRWIGHEELGVYAVSLLAVSMLAFVPGAVGQVLSPRIMMAYGRGGGRSNIAALLKVPILLLGVLLPLMAGLGAACMPIVVNIVLPRYVGCVIPGQILLLSYTPYAARSFAGEVLIGGGLIRRIAILQVMGLVLAGCVNGIAIIRGWGINGIAGGTAVIYWFFGITIVLVGMRSLKMSMREVSKFLAAAFSPSLMMALCIVAAMIFLGIKGVNPGTVDGVIVLLGAYLIAATMLVPTLLRRIKLVPMAR